MTPIFCCGAECGRVGVTIPHFQSTDAGVTVSTSTKRSGARSFNLTLSASSVANTLETTITLGATLYVARCYVYFATIPNTKFPIAAFATASGHHAGLIYSSATGKLHCGTYSSVAAIDLESVGFTPVTGRWYRIDFRVNVAANPWVLALSIDGIALSHSPAIAASTIIAFRMGRGAAGVDTTTLDYYVDDIILSATTGDYPIGPGYVNHFVPTSDGTHNVASSADFKRGAAGVDITNATTDSYLLVDDVPMDDTTADADDYINAIAPVNSTDYVENVFGPASGIATPSVGPRAVEAIVAHHQAGTGAGTSQFRLNDNGTEDTIVSLSGAGVTTIRYARKHYGTMVGGGAWTATRFNNLRIRFGFSGDANPDQYFDCAMIEAEFEDRFGKNNVIQQAVKRANYF